MERRLYDSPTNSRLSHSKPHTARSEGERAGRGSPKLLATSPRCRGPKLAARRSEQATRIPAQGHEDYRVQSKGKICTAHTGNLEPGGWGGGMLKPMSHTVDGRTSHIRTQSEWNPTVLQLTTRFFAPENGDEVDTMPRKSRKMRKPERATPCTIGLIFCNT